MILKNHNNFIEHTLLNILSFLKETIFSIEYAEKKGFLQQLDPRIKILSFIFFLIIILLVKSKTIILFLYIFLLFLTFISKINILYFLKRTLIFIPLFSFFITLPAIFDFFTPGIPIYNFNLLGIKFIITKQGVAGAVLFISRVTASLSFAVLLSLTTKHFELLKVLRIFGIPQIFVMTFGICYRYIYLFIQIIEQMYIAIVSRVGTIIHYKKGQELIGFKIASLWQKSYLLNEEVYTAMISRGYSGEPKLLNEFQIKKIDLIWLIFAGFFILIILKLY